MLTEKLNKMYMIDFETLGNSKNSCVVQVGAVSFDLEKKFKVNIDGASCIRNGAQMDYSTVAWWLQQSEGARQSILQEPLLDEDVAFNQLNDFLSDAEEIWSHATFDFVILMETLRRLNIKPKFGYRTARDIRTLNSLARITFKPGDRKGTHHDGLDDAIYQVGYCLPAIRKLVQVTDDY